MLHAGADTPSTSLYQDEPRFDIAVLGMPFDTAVSYRCVVCALLPGRPCPACHADRDAPPTDLVLALGRAAFVLAARGKRPFAPLTPSWASTRTWERHESSTAATSS